jgi:transposase-like protein
MANRQRDPHKEAFWRRHVEAWRRGGGSIRAYCREAGVSEQSFHAWRRTLAQRAATTTSQAAAQPKSSVFVPVRLVAEPAIPRLPASDAFDGVEVVLRGGRRVRVTAGFAVATLRQVVAVLEGLPC